MAKPAAPDFRPFVRWFWYAVVGAPTFLVLLLLLTWAGLFGSLPSTEEIAIPKSYLASVLLWWVLGVWGVWVFADFPVRFWPAGQAKSYLTRARGTALMGDFYFSAPFN